MLLVVTASAQTAVHVLDDTFVAAAPAVVAAAVAQSRRWSQWWPDLTLETSKDRGLKGRKWRVVGQRAGTAEIWLEPWRDGTVVHLFLRLDPSGSKVDARGAERERVRRVLAWKRTVHALKDELEAGRAPGEAAVT
jgi:hypothetical protein